MRARLLVAGLLFTAACGKEQKKQEDPIEVAARLEAPAMLAELATREEAYHAEMGTYLSLGGEDAWWPEKPLSHARIADAPAAWKSLRVADVGRPLSCQYAVVAGPAGSLEGVGPAGKGLFDKPPASSWYYALARCGERVIVRR